MAREFIIANDDKTDYPVLYPDTEFPYIDSPASIHVPVLVSTQPLLRHICSRRSHDIGG